MLMVPVSLEGKAVDREQTLLWVGELKIESEDQ